MALKINFINKDEIPPAWTRAEPTYAMDAVHHPDDRPWIDKPLQLDEHFETFAKKVKESRGQELQSADYKHVSKQKIRDLVEFGEENAIQSDVFNEVAANCELENFDLPGEMEPQQQFTEVKGKFPKFVTSEIPPRGIKTLKTLEMQEAFLTQATSYEKYKRMRGLRNPNNAHYESAPPIPVFLNKNLVDQEIVVTVRIYRPIKSTAKNAASAMTTAHRFVQEIYMLGSNTLDQLRDLIKCPGDYIIPGDVSDNVPSMKNEEIFLGNISGKKATARDIYKSGFFYIDSCFYNDTRWPDCADLSEVIRQWAEDDPRRRIGPFTTASMEKTTIKSLKVRLGYPYVYTHQGDHEHLFSFIGARLLSADDVQKVDEYPFERSVGMVHSKMCMVCNIFVAKWITTDNERVPEDPFFFCNECYRHFNYNPKKEKLGNFKAYPYVDVNAL